MNTDEVVEYIKVALASINLGVGEIKVEGEGDDTMIEVGDSGVVLTPCVGETEIDSIIGKQKASWEGWEIGIVVTTMGTRDTPPDADIKTVAKIHHRKLGLIAEVVATTIVKDWVRGAVDAHTDAKEYEASKQLKY